MVWPFGKKKIIDLTKNIPRDTSVKVGVEDEYKDLTSSDASNESALGFLGTMASSGSASSGLNTDEISVKHLKVKIEDMEYKFENLRKKLDAALDRLDLAEKKIDRNERR